MKYSMNYVAIVAAATFSNAARCSEAVLMKVADLGSIGINQDDVIAEFSSKFSLKLELADLVEVQRQNEGENLRMEAADHMAIVVPIFNARGPYNKDGQ